MTLVSVPRGLLFPANIMGNFIGVSASLGSNNLNATGDKVAHIGYLQIEGRATSKTIDTSGSSAIGFKLQASTFANAGSTFTVGIQDVSTSAGPPCQPDGVHDVSWAGTGSGALTSAAWNSKTPTSGTKTMSDGDLIAVVFDFTTRAGVDSVVVASTPSTTTNLPITNNFDAAAWGTGAEGSPNLVLTFSDGTLGCIQDSGIYVQFTAEVVADATGNDERGNIFEMPWSCKVDGVWFYMGVTDANADFTISLYSDPLGTPAAIDSVSVIAENFSATGSQSYVFFPFGTEHTLTAGDEYVVAVRATGTGTVRLPSGNVNSASYLALLTGGTTCNMVRRDGGSGAFTETATDIYGAGVRISALDDGAKDPVGHQSM